MTHEALTQLEQHVSARGYSHYTLHRDDFRELVSMAREALGFRDELCRIHAALGPGPGDCHVRVATLVAGLTEAPEIVRRLEGDSVAHEFATELIRFMNERGPQ